MRSLHLSVQTAQVRPRPCRAWSVLFPSVVGQTGNLIEKQEKSTIRNTIKYLRQDGILIYAMPITRMTRDMAVVISKLLRDVQILRKEQDNYYVYIIGVKDIQSEPREEVYKLLMDVEVNAKFNQPSRSRF